MNYDKCGDVWNGSDFGKLEITKRYKEGIAIDLGVLQCVALKIDKLVYRYNNKGVW